MKTNTKQKKTKATPVANTTEGRKLLALYITDKQMDALDKACERRSRTRSGQVRAMIAWLLCHKQVLAGI